VGHHRQEQLGNQPAADILPSLQGIPATEANTDIQAPGNVGRIDLFRVRN